MADLPELRRSLATLFRELVEGPPADEAFVLNGGDAGLLASLERLSAAAASQLPAGGGASIAAHVDHVCFGLERMNRWGQGEANPWQGADWAASWRRTRVDEREWAELRERLRSAVRAYPGTIETTMELTELTRTALIGTVVHLGYHFGAIRQIDRSIRGPSAEA